MIPERDGDDADESPLLDSHRCDQRQCAAVTACICGTADVHLRLLCYVGYVDTLGKFEMDIAFNS